MYFNRAGKPPPGLHLDVMKDGKMIQVGSVCLDSFSAFF